MRTTTSSPSWVNNLSEPVPVHIGASAYLAADAALAHAASVVAQLTANGPCAAVCGELEPLRRELVTLGYLGNFRQ